jgi:hypothetical protein
MRDGRPTLETRLHGHSRDAVVGLVAALYTARGARTRCDGSTVAVDGDRYLVVPAGPVGRLRDWLFGPDSDAVDAVVALDSGRADALAARYDAPAVTPADLDALARYGLDRQTADAVVRETLGVGLDALRPAAQPTPRESLASDRSTDVDDGRPPARSTPGDDDRHPVADVSVPQSLAVVAVVAVVLVAMLALTPGLLGADSGPFGDGTDPSASDAPDGAATATDAPSPSSASASGDALRLAPGLTTDGVSDADALAEAHATTLSNRSYTWELTYVASVDGTERGRLVESVAVEAPTRYVSTVRVDGTVGSRGPIADRSSYADGDRRYHRTSVGYDAEPLPANETLGLHERRARQYVRVLLDGMETSIVRSRLGEPRLYVVDVQGTPARGVRNYTATAHVGPDGVVYYYSGSYCITSFGSDAAETCYSLTMRYRRLGATAVEAPAWYRRHTLTTTLTTTETTRPPTNSSSNRSADTPTDTSSPSSPSSSPSASASVVSPKESTRGPQTAA